MKRTLFLVTLLALGGGNCDGDNGFTPQDAGNGGPAGVTYDDIGTVCTYDPANPLQHPTNTCPKAGMTCVIASADGLYREHGNFLYEAIPLFTRFLDQTDEGICTLASGPGQLPPICPYGTVNVPLSTGHRICMKLCDSSVDCNRDGYVCDYRFMDASTYDPQSGAVAPLGLKVCVPGCQTDLPYCTRTFMLPEGLVVYDGDLMGWRECNTTSGLCEDLAFKGSSLLGAQCTRSSECGENLICIGGWLYGAPEDRGFCASLCNPDRNLQSPDNGCQLGEGCEYFLDIGYCFPDCISNQCGGLNQVCSRADENKAGIRPGQEWQLPRCIQCEVSPLSCGGGVDAGVQTDAATAADAGSAADAGAGSDT